MPSSVKAKKIVVTTLPKSVKIIYELGAGWGGVACALAAHYPQAQVHAFELSPLPWLVLCIRKRAGRHDNLKIYRKNFYFISLEDADAVVCYLYPGAMHKLEEKFNKELKTNAIVISNSFAVPNWNLEKILVVNDLWKSEILVYKKYRRFF